jgi:Family of unknown function (DUF6515)
MKKKWLSIISISFFTAVLFLALPVNVNAQHKVRKEVVVKKEDSYREVVVKDKHYFYRDGYYYDKRPTGYVKVVAPIGARITILPHGYKVVRMHKIRYYVFGGIYYRYYPREKVYVVVKESR